MKRRFLLLLLFCIPVHSATPDGIAAAAEYYYQRHDYRQALQLWGEVLKRKPENVEVMLKVSELKLMFENRTNARETVLKFLEQRGPLLEPWIKRNIYERFAALQSTFISDEAQSLYLQAKPKIRFKDYLGALQLLNQSLSMDPGNALVLREKADCEKQLKQWDRFVESSKLAYEADPFNPEVFDSVLEGYIFKQDYPAVVSMMQKSNEVLKNLNARVGYAYALLETGNFAEASVQFQGLMHEKIPPEQLRIVYFGLSRSEGKMKGFHEASSYWLEKAKSIPKSQEPTGWDPYQIDTKIALP